MIVIDLVRKKKFSKIYIANRDIGYWVPMDYRYNFKNSENFYYLRYFHCCDVPFGLLCSTKKYVKVYSLLKVLFELFRFEIII